MKKTFYKISSFCMALLVLLSTLSFSVDTHYCGDIIVDSSLFGHAETCSMEVQQKLSSSECDITKKDCCNDQQFSVDGQDYLKISFDKLENEKQIFIAAFIYSYIDLFEELQTKKPSYRGYSPPHLVRDIQVLDQTYLI